MMALSKEEDNYIRMSLLLTGISPRAVRSIFDREFHPSSLDKSLKHKFNTLKDLQKKRIISSLQWNMLFPRFPDVPDSKNFDVTLMVTLLRNLTPMNSPINGYDCLPSINETTESSDLARIKYFRNYLAHLDCPMIETQFFKSAWEDITKAVFRLGGHLMKDECDTLSIKNLEIGSAKLEYEKQKSKIELENLRIQLGIVKVQIEDIKEKQQNWQFEIPRNVRTQFASETSVKVEWEPPEKTSIHFQGYKIYWKEKGTVDREHKEVSKDDKSVIIDGLMELTHYWLWVSAVSNEDEETLHHSPLIIFQTQKGVPTRPPQKLTCIPNQNGTSIDVSWEAPPEEHNSNISGYNVYSQKTSDKIEEEAEFKTSTGFRTVLTDLLPSTEYRIWISALSVNGSGPSSEESIVSTNANVAHSSHSTTFNMFNDCDLRKAKLKVKMPAAWAQNMALNQGNISSKKHEVNHVSQLLLDNSNANLPIEPLRKKRPIEPLRKNRNRKCKKIKK